MELDEKKKILRSYRRMEKEIDALREVYERLKSESEKVTTTFNEIGGGGGTKQDDKMQKIIERLIEVENRIAEIIEEKQKKREQIFQAVEKLDEMPRLILYLYYICGTEMPEIAEKLGFSERKSYYLLKSAVNEIEF